MARVQQASQKNTLLRFYLGPQTVYLITGSQGIKSIFGRAMVHTVTNQEQMTQFALSTLYKLNKNEVQRWKDDKSGVAKTPIAGTESTPTRQRLWFMYEHIYAEFLGEARYFHPIAEGFARNLNQILSSYPAHEWTAVSIRDFCRSKVVEASVNSLFGPDLTRLTPDLIERFWEFDKNVFKLVMGLPKWINAGPVRAHDRFVDAIRTWLDAASMGFDWDGQAAEAEWEPRFGGRAPRELIKWMKETGWRSEVIAATVGALVFAIPTTTWMLMEIVKDPSLLQRVRDEVDTVIQPGPDTGEVSINHQKLVALPLLQSIFTETLRLRINFNIMRDVKQPIILDGHTIPSGVMLQAPMQVAHYNDNVWNTTGDHPANEFWAERHIRYTDHGAKRAYAIAGSPASYFPFGGGANICPGRRLAKSEILTTVALVVSRFDIEFVGWTNFDGSPSSREARSDLRFSGAGAMPPDRDMVLKWKST
ncbi:hypothetical protein N0V93_007820 [Gnomoniopsis smithogilvyi]|uniref:Cytochrome P450 n=1 Tax=Gnomoniopsis smithogilvyi TaxID=1191159 RepID=A0A9W8YM13_9PEZI|nr:hypothetical protein N0V93_007820 [Gnomoniopsis smithogilvyi]